MNVDATDFDARLSRWLAGADARSRAAAVLGALWAGPEDDASLESRTREFLAGFDETKLAVLRIESGAAVARLERAIDDGLAPAACAQSWHALQVRAQEASRRPLVRVSFELGGADPTTLTALFGRMLVPELDQVALSIASTLPLRFHHRYATTWAWPLRIDVREAEPGVGDALARSYRANFLQSVGDEPASMRVLDPAAAPADSHRAPAAFAVVQGDVLAPRLFEYTGTLLERGDYAGLIAVGLRGDAFVRWFLQLLDGIAHDDPVDVAARHASNALGVAPALVVAPVRALDEHRLVPYVRRFGEWLRSTAGDRLLALPALGALRLGAGDRDPGALASHLLQDADSFDWTGERHAATDLLVLRDAVESQSGVEFRPWNVPLLASAPPPAMSADEPASAAEMEPSAPAAAAPEDAASADVEFDDMDLGDVGARGVESADADDAGTLPDAAEASPPPAMSAPAAAAPSPPRRSRRRPPAALAPDAMPPPPPPPPPPPAVQARLRGADDRVLEEPACPAAGDEVALELWIGYPDVGVTTADAPFDTTAVRGDARVQRLEFIVVPLEGACIDGAPLPVRRPVDFDRDAWTSTRARVELQVNADAQALKVRLLIAQDARILQSLRYEAPVAPARTSGQGRALVVENLVQPDLRRETATAPASASLVLDLGADDKPRALAVTRERLAFVEPKANFGAALEALNEVLGRANADVDADGRVDDEDLTTLVRYLALLGRDIYDTLLGQERQLARWSKVATVQVVESRYGAYLPIEFFYEGPAPDDDAVLCEHGRQAGYAHGCCETCPNRASAKHVCPGAFWGFQKNIERRPKDGETPDWADYEVGEPGVRTEALRPLQRLLYTASAKITGANASALDAAFAPWKPRVERAADWTEWKAKIGGSPTVLCIVTHTAKNVLRQPALEAGTSTLDLPRIDQATIIGAAPPLVLLLGCTTNLDPRDLYSVAARFKQKGSAIVVSTLAAVHVAQPPAVVQTLLGTLQRRLAGPGPVTFASVLAETRRELLKGGYPIAFTLTSIGDGEWNLVA